jgi:hypothetical protein
MDARPISKAEKTALKMIMVKMMSNSVKKSMKISLKLVTF